MMDKFIQTLSAIIAAVCGFLLGKADGLLYALIVFMVLDYVTGVIVAIKRKTLNSEIGFTGIAKKVMILVLVTVGHILDCYVIGGGVVCRNATIGFYIANEGISILENVGNFIKLPKKLKAVLEQLKSDSDKEDNDHEN